MTTPILEALVAKGVHVLLKESAEGFAEAAGGLTVQLKSGQQLEAKTSS